MKTKITLLGLYLALFIPAAAHAENIQNLTQLISYLKTTINSIIPLLFGIALVVFIWGVIKYMNADGTAKLAEARNYIIFSILAITIMLSVWGIALMIKNTFFEGAKSPVNLSGGNTTSLSCSSDPDCGDVNLHCVGGVCQ